MLNPSKLLRKGVMKTVTKADVKTTPLYMQHPVPVGVTPVPKYETWDEHRAALRRAAAATRKKVMENNFKKTEN